jgi:hypothetical protein
MVRRRASVATGLFLIISTVAIPGLGYAKAKAKAGAAPQDRIDILAMVPARGGAITRVTMTQHYSRSYLYLEHASGSLTLLDVTDARHPSIIANTDLPPGESGSILTAAGDAALVSSETAPAATPKTRTMSIVDFSDPAHPQTVKQFTNVTCTALDNGRGLIFVANNEGLWILHRNPAEDPQVQENYAHEVLYNH